MDGEEKKEEAQWTRRDFIFLRGKTPKDAVIRWASALFGATVLTTPGLALLYRKLSEFGGPDIEIPEFQKEKIIQTDKLLSEFRNKILPHRKVETKIPDLNSESFQPITFAKLLTLPSFRRNILVNNGDFKVWLKDSKNYGHQFDQHRVEVTGGIEKWRQLARGFLSAFVPNEQWRISSITLSDHNTTMGSNDIFWEAGLYGESNEYQGKEIYLLGIYKVFLHELTHACTPFRPIRKESPPNKIVVLPYGLGHSIDFINGWLTAINSDFDFFKERYLKEEHETFGFLKEGNVGRFVDEVVAMLVADYVFPDPGVIGKLQSGELEDPYKNHSEVEQMIRKTLAYVQYGTRGLETYPDGVPSRRESNYQNLFVMK